VCVCVSLSVKVQSKKDQRHHYAVEFCIGYSELEGLSIRTCCIVTTFDDLFSAKVGF